MDRDFKGVWIPKEIYLDNRLSALDKIILTEIDSLDMSDKGCFASNKHIADFCQCSETKVSNSISKLVKYGFLEIKSFDGRIRILKSCLTKNARLIHKNCEADTQKMRHSNTINKTDINITPISPKGNDFEKFWNAYPNKKAKAKADQAFKKVKVDIDILLSAIEKFKSTSEWQKDNGQFIPYPASWLNQKRWEDEQIQPKKASMAYKINRG